jgi:hypothetical protein
LLSGSYCSGIRLVAAGRPGSDRPGGGRWLRPAALAVGSRAAIGRSEDRAASLRRPPRRRGIWPAAATTAGPRTAAGTRPRRRRRGRSPPLRAVPAEPDSVARLLLAGSVGRFRVAAAVVGAGAQRVAVVRIPVSAFGLDGSVEQGCGRAGGGRERVHAEEVPGQGDRQDWRRLWDYLRVGREQANCYLDAEGTPERRPRSCTAGCGRGRPAGRLRPARIGRLPVRGFLGRCIGLARRSS